MAATATKKEANIQWFRGHLGTLLADVRLKGKFVVVHDMEVKSKFDTFETALREAISKYPADEFAIQQVIEDNATINYLRAAI
jgi:hypothetical protein